MRSVTTAQQYFYYSQIFGRSRSSVLINNVLLRVEGTVNFDRLESCFVKLISAHEALRAIYSLSNMIVYEQLCSVQSFVISRIIDLSTPLLEIVNSLQFVFDLKTAPHIRAYYIRHSEGDHLLIQLPHINSDGWSMGIVIKHLCKFYNNLENAQLPKVIPFDFYRIAFNRYQNSSIFQKDKLFWEAHIKELTESAHPLEIGKGMPSSFCGRVPEYLIEKIKKIADSSETSHFQVFLFTAILLLHKVNGNNPVHMMFSVHNRTFQMFLRDADFYDTVGLFVNRLISGVTINGRESMIDFFARAKDDLMMLMKHQ